MPKQHLPLFSPDSSGSPDAPNARAKRHLAWSALMVGSLLVTSCSMGQAASGPDHGAALTNGEQPTIVVTMDIWADIVANVACQGDPTAARPDSVVHIETLIPPGSDPHGFEASLRDRTDLGQASLIISNGLGLEESLEQTVESAEADGVTVFRIGDHLDLADHNKPTSSDQEAEGASHHHEGADPHIWLDPLLVAAAVPEIAEHLITHAGLDPEAVEQCAEGYRQELIGLDHSISQTLAKISTEQRNLVTNHDSLGYFAQRYDLNVIGTVIPSSSSLAEASPATIEKLARLITTTDTPAIFSEAQQSNQEAVSLAQRLGVTLVPLQTSSLGNPDSSSATYLGWLQQLADQIVHGLTQ